LLIGQPSSRDFVTGDPAQYLVQLEPIGAQCIQAEHLDPLERYGQILAVGRAVEFYRQAVFLGGVGFHGGALSVVP
jgi:hypothetical protein